MLVVPVAAAASGPDWATVMTAIGTVAVAIVAVWVALYTERRAGRRVADEHQRSARQLADERGRHDKEIADERANAKAQIEEERRVSLEQEQYAEAYKIQVLQGERDGGAPTDPVYEQAGGLSKVYGAIVINRGAYTITGVDAQLRLADHSLVQFAGSERVTGAQELPDLLSDGMEGLLESLIHSDRLAPWDVGLRFYSDPMPLASWYPIVRWTDRWGTRWEHRRGEVRQISESAQWAP
jgi:hypothetical protein